jgi:hypothetical protein
MRTHLGPFYIHELARAIARLPGRAEVDEQEAYRITDDIAEWYRRGEFDDSEVVAFVGDPPMPRSLADMKKDLHRRGESWCLSQPEWRAAYCLTAPAARRYLEGCGFDGALRVLREWLGDSPGRRKPTADELDEWMRRNVLQPAKREPTIKACMEATGATWRDASAARTRLPEELKLKRGQRAAARKNEE